MKYEWRRLLLFALIYTVFASVMLVDRASSLGEESIMAFAATACVPLIIALQMTHDELRSLRSVARRLSALFTGPDAQPVKEAAAHEVMPCFPESRWTCKTEYGSSRRATVMLRITIGSQRITSASLAQCGTNPWIPEALWTEMEATTIDLIAKYSRDGDAILDVGVGLGRLLSHFHG